MAGQEYHGTISLLQMPGTHDNAKINSQSPAALQQTSLYPRTKYVSVSTMAKVHLPPVSILLSKKWRASTKGRACTELQGI